MLISDLYPMTNAGDGIFSDFSTIQVMPWDDIAYRVPSDALNRMYFAHSADRTVSPHIERIKDSHPSDWRDVVAEMVWYQYSKIWPNLWRTVVTSYNPIQNYDMTETETISIERDSTDAHTGTDNRSLSNTRTETGTDNRSLSNTRAETGTDNRSLSNTRAETGTDTTVTDASDVDSVWGFNSSNSVGDRQTDTDSTVTETKNITTTDSGSDNLTRNLSTTDSGSDNLTRNLSTTDSGSDNLTRNLTDTGHSEDETLRQLRRSGNIGVTTTQQMIEQERSVLEWVYFSRIFEDIDKVLTLDIY